MSRFPCATYRVQLGSEFRFEDVARRLPYLSALGVSHLYLSPCLRARPGSAHGYDISNHRELNPELGSREDFDRLATTAKRLGIGIIFDIVPNHMGILGNGNDWWSDVLENGPASPFASHFDIDWHSSLKQELRNKVLLPILGQSYGASLESGELQLILVEGKFFVAYFEHRLPISPCSIEPLLFNRMGELEQISADSEEDVADVLEYQSIVTAVRNLPRRFETSAEKTAERTREKEVIRRRIDSLLTRNTKIRESVERTLLEFNGSPGNGESFNKLHELLNAQAYRLSHFRVAMDEINYRRFFDINELAAICMERTEVFEAAHSLILELVRDNSIDGLRIDHIDGLFDPRRYLEQLREATAGLGREPTDSPYLVVEKILALDEQLPENWPVDGTTGYEFLTSANLAFVDKQNEKEFNRIYSRWSSGIPSFHEVAYRSRDEVQRTALSSELHVLAHQLDAISELNRHHRDFTLAALTAALRDVISQFPVYRSYVDEEGVSERDRRRFELAVRQARRRNPAVHPSIFDFLLKTLLLQSEGADAEYSKRQLAFVRKFQQVTSPVAAKGVEDTAFYIFSRLLSLNEVGGSPEVFGADVEQFHLSMRTRQEKLPGSLSPLSTHDTKRGEDMRARLNVLSEMPEEFSHLLAKFDRMNRKFSSSSESGRIPNKNTTYFIYQTLIGSWPTDFSTETLPRYRERVSSYLQKAIHEAKQFTSWVNPDEKYDRAVASYIERVLDEQNIKFLAEMKRTLSIIIQCGLLNALAQTALKFCCPGVPDIYQGTELWDFSLVDPDNRRPVDYEAREEMLAALTFQFESESPHDWQTRLHTLLDGLSDGRGKLLLTHRLLQLRRRNAELFKSGEYVPLNIQGENASHLIGFIRARNNKQVLVLVPRLFYRLLSGSPSGPRIRFPFGRAVWKDTRVELPSSSTGLYENVLTKETITLGQHAHTGDLFAHFPVTILESK